MIAVTDTGTGMPPRDPRQGVRAVLHHQGGRQGHRPRPQHGLWLRQAVGRAHQHLQRGGSRHDHPHLSAARACAARTREPRPARSRRRGRRRDRSWWSRTMLRSSTYVTAQLAKLGYRDAVGGECHRGARARRERRQFDLLFTDVILPGPMNGRELADTIAKRRRAIKVLFTSGYCRPPSSIMAGSIPGFFCSPSPIAAPIWRRYSQGVRWRGGLRRQVTSWPRGAKGWDSRRSLPNREVRRRG